MAATTAFWVERGLPLLTQVRSSMGGEGRSRPVQVFVIKE